MTSAITNTFYPWLEPVWQRLLRLFVNERVPHALLLSGAKGIGKTLLVQAFEKLLLCQTPRQQEACGACPSCYLFEQNHHPDIRRLGEEVKTISIEDIRELTHFLEQKSHQKGYKVVTLFQGDHLSIICANALLKMLEEPLGKTVFILIAERPHNVLATLKSRCIHIQACLPALPTSLSWLQSCYPGKELRNLQQSLALAGGSPLRAQIILEGNTDSWRSAFTRAILVKPEDLFDSEDIQKFIVNQPKEALYLFYYWVAEAVRFAAHAFTEYLYTGEETKHLKRLAQIPLKKIFIFFEDLTESIKALSLPGTNKQLLFEALFYQWQQMCREKGAV